MFNNNFYPTPNFIIELMTQDLELNNKTILEPSAGSGNIIDFLTNKGAKVICCENDPKLRIIAQSKATLIAEDFFTVESHQISHIDAIILNPPFSNGADHLLHAYNIAPKGCKIVCLLNSETLNNAYTQKRKELKTIVENYGNVVELGDCFKDSERKTGVKVALINIQKEGQSTSQEFEGFFMEEEPQEKGEIGLMSYNVVRDLVNRYVEACKIYSEILTVRNRLNNVTGNFFNGNTGIQLETDYNIYKKSLQKAGWQYIFNKMNLDKVATKGLREDINNFVEQQKEIPFTMKNIYHMLDIVIQTTGQRMDKAILEVFDRLTKHHHDNRYNVKGYKTNSHFLVGKKFILPNQINPAKEYGYTSSYYTSLNNAWDGTISDLEKALCYITGDKYEEREGEYPNQKYIGILTLRRSIDRNTYGDWYNSHYFKYKGYKNGNMHFEFIDENVWALFNKKVAELKGYPLFEGKEQTKYQDRQTGRAYQKKSNPAHQYKPSVLFEVEVL